MTSESRRKFRTAARAIALLLLAVQPVDAQAGDGGFHRIFDFYYGLGYPDLFHACLEAHPGESLAIEACSSAIGLHSVSVGAYTLHAGPRWAVSGSGPANHVQRGYSGWNWGPMGGVRWAKFMDSTISPFVGQDDDDRAWFLDLALVLEGSAYLGLLPHLGLLIRLELNTSLMLDNVSQPDNVAFGERFIFPLGGKFSLGMTF